MTIVQFEVSFLILLLILAISDAFNYNLDNYLGLRNVKTSHNILNLPMVAADLIGSVQEESLIQDITRDTDKGSSAAVAVKAQFQQVFEQLTTKYSNYRENSLEDPDLYGNYEVSFVDTSSSQEQEGNPAGGGYRGNIGKFFFKTVGLYQHLYESKDTTTQKPIVVNYVDALLFGFIYFGVILRGTIDVLDGKEKTALMDKYGQTLSKGTVKAAFDPPLICIGSKKKHLALSVGPKSSVGK